MDMLCLKAGIHGMAPPIAVAGVGSLDIRTSNSSQISNSAVGRNSTAMSLEKQSVSSSPRNSPWGFSFRYPFRSLWQGGKNRCDASMAVEDAVLLDEKEDKKEESGDMENDGQNGNWVFKILHVQSLWKKEREDIQLKTVVEEERGLPNDDEQSKECFAGDRSCDECSVGNDDDEKIGFDRDSFSKLLRRVSLAEARLYAQMSYLGNLAYSIPQIKPGNLLRNHRLHFVTSSLEKKEQALKADKEKASAEDHKKQGKASAENQHEKQMELIKDMQLNDILSAKTQELNGDMEVNLQSRDEVTNGTRISAAAAYQIAASAASYLHSHPKSLLPFKYSKSNVEEDLPDGTNAGSESRKMMNEEVASLMATTDSVTAVVAAKEEVKQAVADDLNSTRSSPCEWFICDDNESATRIFVIQGSESLSSWQANLLFEPIQFEEFDVLVHRGIYEAAKGIYEQMLPEVRAHLRSYGKRATFRFTGHSLGGSLSLLINLMLLIRGEVPSSSLLPVITFGAPTIMCGGDQLLHKLGLPKSRVKSIIMHRDIVPRAFSCCYPKPVEEFLKAVNGNFRSLPWLNNQKFLYAPMGEFLILQPDKKFSPSHHLLPSGSGLYLLNCTVSDTSSAEKQIQTAQAAFLNSPHPLEILSDRAAYGSGGTIQRDHDMNSYLKSVRTVIRQELNHLRKVRRQHSRKNWWPLVAARGINAGIIVGRPVASVNTSQGQFKFSGIFQTGRESLKRFSRLVASQHIHLLLLFLFPARLLILGSHNVIIFH